MSLAIGSNSPNAPPFGNELIKGDRGGGGGRVWVSSLKKILCYGYKGNKTMKTRLLPSLFLSFYLLFFFSFYLLFFLSLSQL